MGAATMSQRTRKAMHMTAQEQSSNRKSSNSSISKEQSSNSKLSNSQIHEYFLRINYIGDVAMAFMKDQLVQDAFYDGDPWTIGLKRYAEDLKTNPMTFYFRPLKADAPFLGDLRKSAIPDFSKGAVVDIKNVEVIPEYKFNIKF